MEDLLKKLNVRGSWYGVPHIYGSYLPTGRVGHTAHALYINSVHGGKRPLVIITGGADPSAVFNEAHILDISSCRWHTISVSEAIDFPSLGRYEHSSALLCNQELLIFGGATKSGPLNQLLRLQLDDLSVPTENSSVFEIQSFTGSIKQISNHTNPACKLRTQHSSVSLTEYDQLLIFSGGDVGSQTVSDDKVHMYDSVLDSWIEIPVEGISPCSRLGHLMLYESPCQPETSNAEHRIPKGKLYIHGGMADDELFDDLYALHFVQCDNGDVHFKGVWSKLYPNINADDDADAIDSNEKSNTPHLKPLGHISPDSRAAHGGAILTNKIFGSDTTKIFIFGGFSTTGALNDMFCFDTNLKQWSEIKCETGVLPAPRLDFAYCVVTLTVQKKNAKIKLMELTRNSSKDDQSKGDTNDKDEEGEGNDEEKSNDDDDDDVDAYCQDYFFIHGGMDTEGKVFNDAYLLLLSEYQISNPMNCQTILNEYTCKNI